MAESKAAASTAAANGTTTPPESTAAGGGMRPPAEKPRGKKKSRRAALLSSILSHGLAFVAGGAVACGALGGQLDRAGSLFGGGGGVLSDASSERAPVEAPLEEGTCSAEDAACSADDGAREEEEGEEPEPEPEAPELFPPAPDAAEVDALQDRLAEDIIHWVRSEGGFVHERVDLRKPDDGSGGPRGIFANGTIEEGEVVCTIPWKLIKKPRRGGPQGQCGAILDLYEDLKREDPTPYGKYIESMPRNHLPNWWSDEGQALLSEMIGPKLPPQEAKNDVFLDDRYDNCGFGKDDALLSHALVSVTARADDEFLVPFYDMINHRNGARHYNTRHRVEYDDTYELIASRKIEPGEQLHNSYNRCEVCGARRHYFGTPELFQHYGFVESLPQMWLVEQVRLKFFVLEKDDGSGDKYVKFALPPSIWGVDYLKEELVRLEAFRVERRYDRDLAERVPAAEYGTIWTYHRAVVEAFALAVEAAEEDEGAIVSEAAWYCNENWWEVEDWDADPCEFVDGVDLAKIAKMEGKATIPPGGRGREEEEERTTHPRGRGGGGFREDEGGGAEAEAERERRGPPQPPHERGGGEEEEEEDGDEDEDEDDDEGGGPYYQRELWEGLDCDEVFRSERPVHRQSDWLAARRLYRDVVGPDKSTIGPSDEDDVDPPSGLAVSATAKQAPPKGRGVFASEFVPAGTLVWSTKKTARFDNGPEYKRFVRGLERGFACDVIQWAYIQDVGYGELRISVDLDELAFCNDYDWEPNVGFDEEKTRGLKGGVRENYFALRDIRAGEEILCDYGEFAEGGAWPKFGL